MSVSDTIQKGFVFVPGCGVMTATVVKDTAAKKPQPAKTKKAKGGEKKKVKAAVASKYKIKRTKKKKKL